MSQRDVALVAVIGHECSITVGALQSVPGVPSHVVPIVCFDIEALVTLLAVVLILALMLIHMVCVATTRAEFFLTDIALEEDSSIRLRGQSSSRCTQQGSLKQKTSQLGSISICVLQAS